MSQYVISYLRCYAVFPRLLLCRMHLNNSILTRFEQCGASTDLKRAIILQEEALKLCPNPHPNRSVSLSNLAASLLARFERHKRSGDLKRAIILQEEALKLRPYPHPDRSASLGNLAISLLERFQQSKQEVDLTRAITLHEESLRLCSHQDPGRSASTAWEQFELVHPGVSVPYVRSPRYGDGFWHSGDCSYDYNSDCCVRASLRVRAERARLRFRH